jgi:hypothetical protein
VKKLDVIAQNQNHFRNQGVEIVQKLSILCKHRNQCRPVNQIQKLDRNIFQYASNLVLLHLENCHILEIDSLAFTNLGKLNSFYLNNNSIGFLTQYNFKPLNNLVDLQLRGNNLSEIQTSSFNGLTNLKYLISGKQSFMNCKTVRFYRLGQSAKFRTDQQRFPTVRSEPDTKHEKFKYALVAT